MINIEKHRSKTMKRSLLLRAEFLAAVKVIVHAGAILVFYLFVLMLITTSLAAQRSGRAGPGNSGDRCCPVIPPRQILVRVLELSEPQLKEVGVLAKSIRSAGGPLRHELRTLARAFREEHGSDDPDATELGRLLLAIKELQAEICAVTQSYAADFADILDDAQIEKWETIKDRFCNSRRRRGPGRDGPGRKSEDIKH